MMDFEQLFKNIDTSPLGASNRKISEVWNAFIKQLYENPQILMNALQAGQQKQVEIVASMHGDTPPAVAPHKSDRRFQSEHWRTNPFFSFLMQNYLLNSEVFRQIVDEIDMPEKEKKILRFTIEQYINAVAPTNFPATNPDTIEEAVKTKGESLQRGMKNLAEDMKHGMVKNTDWDAFTIGENIAVTPGKVVLQTPVMQLIEYAPQTAKVFARPLLIIPPCINKYYILDLTEEKSLVRHLVAAGHRVFLVSWVNAGQEVAHMTWDDYLRDGVMTAVETVRNISKQDKLNVVGYCIGGTLLVAALAALAVNKEQPAQSLTLLASMVDFSDTGEIGLFIDENAVAERERQYANGGLVDGRELARGFAFLRPNDLIWPYVIDNYHHGKTPQPFDLLFWNADSTNLPGPMFAEYLRVTYLENQISHGNANMCGVDIVPAKIKAPVYVVACEKDHIVPWQTAYQSALLTSKKSRFILAASGHIAGIINPPAQNKGGYFINDAPSLPDKAEDWKNNADRRDGSWWTDWCAWLAKNGGKKIAAPKGFGNVHYRPLEDAPGTYVTMAKPPTSISPTTEKEST